ncbi:hypothetical protein [uncultured Brachyspira sp.]|uniref:hypothetical protein n=1 Tax=uncultured Brachyspira sp. TaxID=221953 RepID=UPI00259382C5|nr:hypothetical protein [uncultured Brachyspira sp.]
MINKKYEEEIIKYLDGIKVSEEFLDELENNLELQMRVNNLKSDLFLMKNIKDSEIFDITEKESEINIKNNIVESMAFFSKIKPLEARGDKDNEIYIFNNIEISKNDNEYYLNIRDIKNYCVIEFNKEKIVNISGEKNNYSMELKRGKYNIKVDNIQSKINIE